MADHDCTIGLLCYRSNDNLVTLAELKEHIEAEMEYSKTPGLWQRKVFSLADYGDKRKSTDLTRFEFCPYCGKPIDWKAIKRADHEA